MTARRKKQKPPKLVDDYRRVPREEEAPSEPLILPPSTGRLVGSIATAEVSWFVPDLIPGATFTMVVGAPGSGKSTFGAYLCSVAKRPVIFPGSEESIETSLVPRLLAAGVKPNACLILDGRLWSFPHDKKALLDVLFEHEADCIWMDPIDSYIGECSENDGQPVRIALESLATIARESRCPLVSARHPGKLEGNLCPGSRQWRAVPRQILSFSHDPGPPCRRWLKIAKDPYSRGDLTLAFELRGEAGQPKTFHLLDSVSQSEAELANVVDPIHRWKIDQATELLQHLLAAQEEESSYVFTCGTKEALNEDVLRKAARRLGVVVRREGVGREHKSYWSLPPADGQEERK